MVYDSISTVGSNLKELGKKKRVNRTAKLNQCKLDVRREQWLSQVKNKGFKEENKGGSGKGENRLVAKLVVNPEENRFRDWESPSNSPNDHAGSLSLISNTSVTNFTTSSSSSGGCYSGSMTEEDDCLDDWEAIADALAADEVKSDGNTNSDREMHDRNHNRDLEPVETIKDVSVNRHRAWRPDDCFRPQGLPNLLKQNSFPMNSVTNGFKNVGFAPAACPICCEDLDLTDSSFLPCPCGYRLCLFCYKRILEDNCRCPGCRKQYEQFDQGTMSSKLARSYSMISGVGH
ncbi:uncharacterized protein LOC143557158 [Bidens hawaiensis]|uniref:uncharacterized protein LOC143557158 n=1 Tax=Bidens hawaiensis TaxID=980011 RepID=UPI00404A19CD